MTKDCFTSRSNAVSAASAETLAGVDDVAPRRHVVAAPPIEGYREVVLFMVPGLLRQALLTLGKKPSRDSAECLDGPCIGVLIEAAVNMADRSSPPCRGLHPHFSEPKLKQVRVPF